MVKSDKVRKLILLAGSVGTDGKPTEEARTAAFLAVQLIREFELIVSDPPQRTSPAPPAPRQPGVSDIWNVNFRKTTFYDDFRRVVEEEDRRVEEESRRTRGRYEIDPKDPKCPNCGADGSHLIAYRVSQGQNRRTGIFGREPWEPMIFQCDLCRRECKGPR